MHASWNLMARYTRSSHIFFERMQLSITIAGFIPVVISEYLTRSIPLTSWIYLLFSSIFCGVYYYSLANSYMARDFTTVYPVVRSLPVLLMGLVDLGRGRMPSIAGWVGMILVATGCIFSPLNSLKGINLRAYLNSSSIWMIMTAIGTVGYSTFDKLASEIVKPGAATAVRYGYFFYAMSGLLYILIHRVILPNKNRNDFSRNIKWYAPLLAGIFNFSSYSLVLWAYQLVGRASYVVTFRQFSIVIGTIAAFVLYHEKVFIVRVLAVLIITFGLLIIALWGK